MGLEFIATGSFLPEKTISNTDLQMLMDTSDEWIYSRTGIRSRHIATTETTEELAVKAAENCLLSSGLSSGDIDLVICATVTSETAVPSVAACVKKTLGLSHALAFDINAACSGFIFALNVAKNMMENTSYSTALIIGAEILSRTVDWRDRSTCVLFGDGAGAAILKKTENPGILSSYLSSQPDEEESLHLINPKSDTPYSSQETEKNTSLQMNGRKVFEFAVKEIPRLMEKIIETSQITLDQVKWIIPHQANVRIIHSVAQRMNIDMDRFFVNIGHVGNTSAASIPIALDELARSGRLEKGDLVLLAGFGGGFTSGAVLLDW